MATRSAGKATMRPNQTSASGVAAMSSKMPDNVTASECGETLQRTAGARFLQHDDHHFRKRDAGAHEEDEQTVDHGPHRQRCQRIGHAAERGRADGLDENLQQRRHHQRDVEERERCAG